MKRFLIIFSVAILGGFTHAQDIEYARSIISSLTAPEMHGRGYVNNGDNLAAQYIEKEFSKLGLKKFGDVYHQSFTHPVNTYPGKMNVRIDGTELIPGKDFIVEPSSPVFFGTFDLYWFDDLILKSE